MLLDAVRAEAYRLSKNLSTVFWSLFFVPIGLIIGSLGISYFLNKKTAELAAKAPTVLPPIGPSDILSKLADMATRLDNPATLAFTLIAAAAIFAGDYRWETWRLISARNSRPMLILGKVLTTLALCLVSLALFLIASCLAILMDALITGRGMALNLEPQTLKILGLGYLIGVAHLFQFTLLALVTAVITRSLMAALFVPIVIAIAQNFVEKALILLQIKPTDWQAILISPGLAVSHIKDASLNTLLGSATVSSPVLITSLGSLVLWIAVPIALSLVLFQRQMLSKE